jgi:hypothetical protein
VCVNTEAHMDGGTASLGIIHTHIHIHTHTHTHTHTHALTPQMDGGTASPWHYTYTHTCIHTYTHLVKT